MSRKSFNINRQVSVVKQGVSIHSFRYFEQILYISLFDFVFIAYKVLAVCRKPGADPGRGEGGSSHGQIFSTLEYFALTFLKILD